MNEFPAFTISDILTQDSNRQGRCRFAQKKNILLKIFTIYVAKIGTFGSQYTPRRSEMVSPRVYLNFPREALSVNEEPAAHLDRKKSNFKLMNNSNLFPNVFLNK